jgi:hypothetical protein
VLGFLGLNLGGERYGASTQLLKVYHREHMLKGELPEKKEGRQ